MAMALLPLLLLAGFAITEAARTYRATEEARLRDTAALVAGAVDARMGAHVAAMATLSMAPSLLRDDEHASFHRRALALAELLRRFARGTPEGARLHPGSLALVVRQTLALAEAALREAALREAAVRVEVHLGEPAPVVMGHGPASSRRCSTC